MPAFPLTRIAVLALLLAVRAGAADVVHRDPVRRFELRLETGWSILSAEAARLVDDQASVVAAHAADGLYLAVEARRLPRVALSRWATAWDGLSGGERDASGRPGGPVQAFTVRRLDAGRVVVVSDFRRGPHWAYRISRLLPIGADRELRDRAASAADGFRLLSSADAAPAAPAPAPAVEARELRHGGAVRDGAWLDSGVAASLRPPPGWRFLTRRDRNVFLPETVQVAVLDTANRYQAGLVSLGDVRHLGELSALTVGWLATNLGEPFSLVRLRAQDHLRVSCCSAMPPGCSPEGMPLTWLVEARSFEGQGVAVLVGVTGLGLEEDHRRMERIFAGLQAVSPSRDDASSIGRLDGAIHAPVSGFGLRLPRTWAVDPDRTEEDAILALRRRRPAVVDLFEPAVSAHVLRLEGREAGAAAALGRRIAAGGAGLQGWRRRPDGAPSRWEGRLKTEETDESLVATLLPRPDGRASLALVSRCPRAATERLAPEIEALHETFGSASDRWTEPPARVEDGVYQDDLRGVRFEAHGEWTWLLEEHARSVDPSAVAIAWHETSHVRLVLAVERIPGLPIGQWGAYQQAGRLRRGPGGRYYGEIRDAEVHAKSILETRQGWCYRATLVLPGTAGGEARAAGHRVLRSFETRDALPQHPPVPERTLPARRIDSQHAVALAIPAGWTASSIEPFRRELPFEILAAFTHPRLGYGAVVAELGPGTDLTARAEQLEAAFTTELRGGRVLRPSRHGPDGIRFEAAADVRALRPGAVLPGRWLVRVARFDGHVYAVLAWCPGIRLQHDRDGLEPALRALVAAPALR